MTPFARIFLFLFFTVVGVAFVLTDSAPPAKAAEEDFRLRIGIPRVIVVPRYRYRRSYRRSYRSYRGRSRSATVRGDADIQRALNYFGFDAGEPDGVFGPQTRAAIKRYQAKIGERQTGRLTAQERAALMAAYAEALNKTKTTTTTTGADDFLQKIRKQDRGTTTAAKDDPAQKRSKAGDATRTAGVSFEALCAASGETGGEAGVIKISAAVTQDFIVKQFCTARSYILAASGSLFESLGNVSPDDVLAQCTEVSKNAFEGLASRIGDDPEADAKDLEKTLVNLSSERDKYLNSYKVCLGFAYAHDNAEMAFTSAATLVGLGERGYGEVIGHHLALGLAVPSDLPKAGAWYAWTADQVDNGNEPVVQVSGYDRSSLLRVMADNLAQSGARKLTPVSVKTSSGNSSGFRLVPGDDTAATGDAATDARTFFAAEQYAMRKSLDALAAALGMPADELSEVCLAQDDVLRARARDDLKELSLRACRAVAYVRGDMRAMYAYDKALADLGDADATQRVAMHLAIDPGAANAAR